LGGGTDEVDVDVDVDADVVAAAPVLVAADDGGVGALMVKMRREGSVREGRGEGEWGNWDGEMNTDPRQGKARQGKEH